MRSTRLKSYISSAAILLTVFSLTACGGGGGDSDTPKPAATQPSTSTPGTSTPATPTDPTPNPTTRSDVSPSCLGCGAVNSNTYSGAGIGVWGASNDSGTTKKVPVSISGLTGQNVRVVYSNPTDADISLSGASFPMGSKALLAAEQMVAKAESDSVKDAIAEFNRAGFAKKLGPRQTGVMKSLLSAPQQAGYTVNSTRQWHHADNTMRTATLVKQMAASDGTMVNVWVESAEIGSSKVSPAIIDSVLDVYARPTGIYDMLKALGGPLWGPQPHPELLGQNQAVDIVVLNFDKNSVPYGFVGYFWSLNNFTKSADADSNESLSLYLDSETMYLGGAKGLQAALMVMAHEGMHMQNFYRRGVLRGEEYMYDLWLEEQTAMMMEDWASSRIDPTFNNVRDMRLPDFVRTSSYDCSLTKFNDSSSKTCESYSVNGSFGGFLNRQLGLSFYKDLLSRFDSTDSKTLLDKAIQAARPDSSFIQEAFRFGVTASALMPLRDAIARYSYPAVVEEGFTLPAIDPSAYAPLQWRPGIPSSLKSFGNFPLTRGKVTGTYAETLPVPPGASVSIVVYPDNPL